MATPQERIAQWADQIQACRLPRYEELPTIDLYMDQVVAVIEDYLRPFTRDAKDRRITPAMINNYVKLKVLPAPEKKRYNRTHLCHLLIICLLKQVLALPEIRDLLAAQLAERDIRAVYEDFCAMQEQHLCQTVDELRAQLAEPGVCLAARTLRFAAQANTHKMIAEKLIDLQVEEPAPVREKKRDRA